MNAKIVNNKIYCKNCDSDNISGVRDYKEVSTKEGKRVLFQVRCYGCNEDLEYLCDVILDGNYRSEINSEIKDVEEEM